MKKYMMIVKTVGIFLLLGGCVTNADSTLGLIYPSLDLQINKIEIEPYYAEIEEEIEELEEPWVETQDGKHDVPGGHSWISAKVSDGKRGYKVTRYAVSYNQNIERLSRVELPDAVKVVKTTPTIYANGQVAKPGATFTSSRVTRYGYDCYGCNPVGERGSTAAGILVGDNEVRQKDGTWKKGITYEGYYVIAASSALPFCSVVEVTNHTFTGNGLTPGVPFKAIVVDRGGAIQGSKIDLFVGSQKAPTVDMGRKYSADFRILSFHSWTRSQGNFSCGV